MSWIIALAVIAMIILISGIFLNTLPKYKIIQKLVDKINLVSRENLAGIMVIRAFNTQKFEENRFDQVNRDLTSTNLFVNRVMVMMFPTMMLIMNAITLLIVWVGAQQIANSTMQVGDTWLCAICYADYEFIFTDVPDVYYDSRALVAAQRIAEV